MQCRREIPFFELFAELPLSGELRLSCWGALIDRRRHPPEGLLHGDDAGDPGPLAPEEPADPKELLMGDYGFPKVHAAGGVQVSATPPPPAEPVAGAPASGGEGRPPLRPREIRGSPSPSAGPEPEDGTRRHRGAGLSADCQETRKPGLWRLSFEMTD